MPINVTQAKAAGQIAAQIEALENLIAVVEQAMAEKWRITVMIAQPPKGGSVLPEGYKLDLLPLYPASEENSLMGLAQAKQTYVAELASLHRQLDEL